MRPLIWFRSDLRTDDNAALSHATAMADSGARAIFIVSPGEWNRHDFAPARVDLMLRSLQCLSKALAKLNIPLLIRTATDASSIPSIIAKVCKEQQCDAVCWNREYEVNESRRDASVAESLAAMGVKSHQFHDQVVMEPGTLRTGEGRIYTVFTPFKKSWIKRLTAEGGIHCHAAPRKMPACEVNGDAVPDRVAGFECLASMSELWPAGEDHARKRLATFIAERGRDYKASRDFPAVDGTSGLSAHLAIGTLSPRRCVEAAVAANAASKSPLDSGSEGLVTWISEVIWREFYVHILAGFPRVCMHRAFQPSTEAIRWNDNPAHFKAWCEGRTGVPIVDAGMRQLVATGWMHNRVRMVTAMYFSKNLFLDWRLGEKFFMQHLVDGFLASNNGGWQWSASTGTDAAPYFRIFNPVSQSQRFDPEGTYLKRWIPELRGLSADSIHDPSALPPLARAGLAYPSPIVDLSRTREAAIAAFKDLRT
jgi:deoxyribodipyrimidine photo-lyase